VSKGKNGNKMGKQLQISHHGMASGIGYLDLQMESSKN
jgi:hypothetical protein